MLLSVILPPWIVLKAESLRNIFEDFVFSYQRIWSEPVCEHHPLTILVKLIIIHIGLTSVSAKTYSVSSGSRPKLGTQVSKSSW